MKVDIVQKKYGKKVILKDIHVTFPLGKTTLIIGTSGAGKSTLIKCMIGATSFKGEVTEYQPEDIAFIPQQPALNQLEIARKAVYWSAVFSRKYHGREELINAVNAQIDDMGLRTVQDHMIKNLSGGQKQRVSIAKELIRGKKIIIADEIDTGLDCGVSRDLIKNLCKTTRKNNTTTIVISHNIVNIDLYDKVIVLAKTEDMRTRRRVKEEGWGGIAFEGSPHEIKQFFEVNDYVDILTKVNTSAEGGHGEAIKYIEKTNTRKRAINNY